MHFLKNLVLNTSKNARKRRALVFKDHFVLDEHTKILDLGSESGSNINSLLYDSDVNPKNVYIADINEELIQHGSIKFGYQPVLINESEPLPFPDKYFDIVFCSSVIEHVTVSKQDVWNIYSGRQFSSAAVRRQKQFAAEIDRLGKQYFVQTPNKHFVIESHSWLPFLSYLPRRVLVPVLRLTNLIWIKKTSPDWHLLSRKEMQALFSRAKIIEEKYWGFTKSLMAVHCNRRPESV